MNQRELQRYLRKHLRFGFEYVNCGKSVKIIMILEGEEIGSETFEVNKNLTAS